VFIASCEQVNAPETLHVHVQLPAMKTVLNSRQKHLSLVFSPLRENRLHVVTSRRGDDVTGHVTPGDVIGEVVVVRAESLTPVCVLNFPVPAVEPGGVETETREVDEMMIERVLKKKKNKKVMSSDDDEVVDDDDNDDGSREVKLRLTDVAEMIHDDWQALAMQLNLTDADLNDITNKYSYPSEQVSSSNNYSLLSQYNEL